MKMLFLATLACVTSAIAAPPVPLELPPRGHPVLGKWQWRGGEKHCTEVYEYRANGSAPIQSGAERTDNRFTISATPDAQGFYRMTTRVIKDYGGQDCAQDASDSTGLESTTYVLISRNRKEMLHCYEPQQHACFGPLHRVLP